jgi:hypothetical protein
MFVVVVVVEIDRQVGMWEAMDGCPIGWPVRPTT